jgi:hypothetical protein
MASVNYNSKSNVDHRLTLRSKQPIVILGGFLASASLYNEMAASLESYTKTDVSIVQTRTVDWLGVAIQPYWLVLLSKLDHTVRNAVKASSTGRITLVAHSAGGLLGRIYLSPEPFYGKRFQGRDVVSHLITLGTPHYGNGKLIYGGIMSRWVNRHYPGAFFSDTVTYIAVAGKALKGDPQGTAQQRRVYKFYRDMTGDGEDWGDGVVPLKSARLIGAHPIELDHVGHYRGFGHTWYGDREIIPLWWDNCD